MELQRQEYPTMLATLAPSQAIDVLHDRVRQVGHLNASIADWLQERRRLEEQYSQGLRKLARRPPPGDHNELGIFSVPWTTLTAALETLAESHHTLSQRIELDVEKPLREFARTNREMQAMTTIQGNLASMARDIDNAEKKNERLAHKGTSAKTRNVANATTDLENAQSQWENQAPYVFEQLQSLDETRLNVLRDLLTQFQTHEVDAVERVRTVAEQCLNVLLNVETADEIKTYALRIASGRQTVPNMPRRGSRQSVIGPSVPTFTAPTAAAAAASSTADDAASMGSGSGTTPHEPEKKPKGLKRLGTLMGRKNRESKIFPSRGGSESPERNSSRGTGAFNSFSGRFGRGRDLPTPLEESEETRERPRSPLRTVTSADSSQASAAPGSRGERDRHPQQQQHIDGTAQSLAAAGLLTNGNGNGNGYTRPDNSHQNDLSQLQEPLQPAASTPVREQPQPQAPVQAQAQTQAYMAPAEAFQPQRREVESPRFEAPRDNDGYSERPSAVDPISQAEREAAEAADASHAFNVNIRQAPIAEEGSDPNAVYANMANTLKMQAPPPASTRRAGTVRGRRDMRNSVYSPSPAATPEPVLEEPNMAPIAPPSRTSTLQIQPTGESFSAASAFGHSSESARSPTAASFTSSVGPGNAAGSSFWSGSAAAVAANVMGRPGSSVGGPGPGTSHSFDHNDATSIRSGRSLSSTVSATNKHPDLHAPGLNASVLETVSAWFEHGLCTRSVVIGEVALAYNSTDYTSPSGLETIRLDGFDGLEKVAPNPAFISDAGVNAKGEYAVDIRHLARTSVAFKYQLSAPTGGPGAHAPLLISPAWKIEAHQASAIVSYSLNPSFSLPTGQDVVTLQNLTLVLHLDPTGGKAASCQSKPVGTFDRARQTIYWKVGDVTLRPGDTTQKLLARFMTPEGQARGAHVEARWDMAHAVATSVAVSVKDETGGSDPFADENAGADAWKVTEGVRKCVAGTYQAM